MTNLKKRMEFCADRCVNHALPQLMSACQSSWLDGADMAAKKIAAEILDSDGGTVMICGVEVLPQYPDTAPELVERLRAAVAISASLDGQAPVAGLIEARSRRDLRPASSASAIACQQCHGVGEEMSYYLTEGKFLCSLCAGEKCLR